MSKQEYSFDQYKNIPGFQEYRTNDNNDPLVEEEENGTTKQELTFEEPVPKMTDQNTLILQALTKLLAKQDSVPTFRARIREPDTYHGDRGLDAAIGWVRSVERYLEIANLGEHQWVDYAVTLLRDEADTWWRQQEATGGCDEWKEFKKRLLANFSPPNRLQLARDRLASLSQTGTVAAFVSQFQAAWASVPTMDDEEALDRFQRGLTPAIRLQVLTRFPKSADEAMHLALTVEAAQQQSQAILQGPSSYQTQVQPHLAPEYLRTSGVAPMDLDAIRSRGPGQWRSAGRSGSNWHQQDNQRNNNFDKECYNCGGMGHISRFCSSPRRTNASRSSNQGRQGNQQSRWNQGKADARQD